MIVVIVGSPAQRSGAGPAGVPVDRVCRFVHPAITGHAHPPRAGTVGKAFGGALGKAAARFLTGLATLYLTLDAGVKAVFALKLSWFMNLIREHNTTAAGVAIGIEEDGSVTILDRGTGRATRWAPPWWDRVGRTIVDSLPTSMRVGEQPVGDPDWYKNYHFTKDEAWALPQNGGPVQP